MLVAKLTAASPQMSIKPRSRGSRLRTGSEQGQALFEFALCMPVLMLIVTGMFTFAIFLHDYLELTDAVSIGARLVAVERGQTTDPCHDASTAIANAAPLLTASNLTYSFVFNGTGYAGSSCSSSSTTTGAAGNLVQGQPAQVTVTYPCTLKWYGSSLPTCTLTAKATELIQ